MAANIGLMVDYPLFCRQPENQNIAQSVGYLVQEYGDEWGGRERIAFYFPTGSLYAYIPEQAYITVPVFDGIYTFDGCSDQRLNPESLAEVDMLILLPHDYDIESALNAILDYAVVYDCERERHHLLEIAAPQQGFTHHAGRIISADGRIHANILAREPLELGDFSLEETNRWHYEEFSRQSWVKP